MFCSPFDENLAAGIQQEDPGGPGCGELRFHLTWTRDAWGRAPGPHEPGWRWLLLRDRDTGFVQLALVTSPTLIASHPRADVRSFETRDQAEQHRARFGEPPFAETLE